MQNFLIIPKINNLDESLKLAEEYGFGFEYNDFFIPDTMDDKGKKKEIISNVFNKQIVIKKRSKFSF